MPRTRFNGREHLRNGCGIVRAFLGTFTKGWSFSGTFVSPLKINSVSPEGTIISPLDSDLALSGPYKDDCRA